MAEEKETVALVEEILAKNLKERFAELNKEGVKGDLHKIRHQNLTARTKGDLVNCDFNGSANEVMSMLFRLQNAYRKDKLTIISEVFRSIAKDSTTLVSPDHVWLIKRIEDDGMELPPMEETKITILELDCNTDIFPQFLVFDYNWIVFSDKSENITGVYNADIFIDAYRICEPVLSIKSQKDYPLQIIGKYWKGLISPRMEYQETLFSSLEIMRFSLDMLSKTVGMNRHSLMEWLELHGSLNGKELQDLLKKEGFVLGERKDKEIESSIDAYM